MKNFILEEMITHLWEAKLYSSVKQGLVSTLFEIWILKLYVVCRQNKDEEKTYNFEKNEFLLNGFEDIMFALLSNRILIKCLTIWKRNFKILNFMKMVEGIIQNVKKI